MNSKLVIRKHDIKYIILCFILSLISLTGSLLVVIIPSYTLRGVIIGIGLFIEILIFFGKKMTKYEIPYLILIFLMLLVVFNNTAWPTSSIISFICGLLICLVYFRSNRLTDYMLAYMGTIYTFYAIITILCRFSRSFYMNYVITLFPEQKSKLIFWYNQGSMAGLTDHYSTNAMFLATGALLAYCTMTFTKKRIHYIWFYLMAISLLLTGKRGHIIFIAMAIFLLYFFSTYGQKPITRLTKIIGVLLGVACIAVVLFNLVPSLGVFVQRFQSAEDISEGRFKLWILALYSFKKHPILGIGWKQYAPMISPMFSSSAIFDTHNVYLQLLCETGIIGFLIYIVWFSIMYFIAIKMYRVATLVGSNESKYYLGFSLAYQTFFLLYCFTGNPLYDKMTFVPYFISCGIALYYMNSRGRLFEFPCA